jgi:putative ABC transport system substrate-binding protein
MVPRYDQYQLDKAPHLTGIALTSDLSLELSTLKAVLPRASVIGIAFDPRYSKDVIDAAAQSASARGQVLVPMEVDSPAKVEKVLKANKGKIDALLLIADRTVGNLTVVQRLLQWGHDEKLPVVGFAPSQVKEGALFALTPMSVGLGQQAGRIANRIIHERVDPGSMAVAAPEGVELHVSFTAASQVANSKDFAFELFNLAAKQGLAVRVVE